MIPMRTNGASFKPNQCFNGDHTQMSFLIQKPHKKEIRKQKPPEKDFYIKIKIQT